MATSSQTKALLGGIPSDLKKPLGDAFDYVLNNNIAFGPIDPDTAQTKTTNHYGRYVRIQTPSVSGQEFSAAHGLGRVPNIWWVVGSATAVGSRMLGDLTVSRAADAKRLYFVTTATSVTAFLYVE